MSRNGGNAPLTLGTPLDKQGLSLRASRVAAMTLSPEMHSLLMDGCRPGASTKVAVLRLGGAARSSCNGSGTARSSSLLALPADGLGPFGRSRNGFGLYRAATLTKPERSARLAYTETTARRRSCIAGSTRLSETGGPCEKRTAAWPNRPLQHGERRDASPGAGDGAVIEASRQRPLPADRYSRSR